MVMRERQTFWNRRRDEFNATESDDGKILPAIVGRDGRKWRLTGQVLPVRPIRVADLSGDDDDDRSLWPKKHPRPGRKLGRHRSMPICNLAA